PGKIPVLQLRAIGGPAQVLVYARAGIAALDGQGRAECRRGGSQRARLQSRSRSRERRTQGAGERRTRQELRYAGALAQQFRSEVGNMEVRLGYPYCLTIRVC